MSQRTAAPFCCQGSSAVSSPFQIVQASSPMLGSQTHRFPGRRGRAERGAGSCQGQEGKNGLKALGLCNGLENIWAATVTAGPRFPCTQMEDSWATLKKRKRGRGGGGREVKTPGLHFRICGELLHVAYLLLILSTLKNEQML